MADEGEETLEKAVIWLQKQQESLTGGFTVEYKGGEYTFFPKYIDRYNLLFLLKVEWLTIIISAKTSPPIPCYHNRHFPRCLENYSMRASLPCEMLGPKSNVTLRNVQPSK